MNSTLKNILTITLPTVFFLFVILEVAVRLIKAPTSLDQLTGKERTKNPMSIWAKNSSFFAYTAIPGKYSENKSVNSHGFISTPEIGLEKDSNTTRIVFLGGSSTAGTGYNLPDDHTWPWQTIEKTKLETKKNLDFINGALGGYSTFESYGRLWSNLRFYMPDIVIVYHGWNDMYYFNEISNKPITWRDNFSVSKMVDSYKTYEPHWADSFISWSQLLSKIRIKLTSHYSDNCEQSNKNKKSNLKDTFNKKGLNIYEENLKLIMSFCKAYDIEFFICKQATLITENTKKEDKKRCRYEYHKFNHKAHIEAFDSLYKIIDKIVPRENIIDLTRLSGNSLYFNDHIHQTKIGNTKIAEIVTDSLKSNYFNN